MTQPQRIHAMERFKRNHTEILVATDVAARGIDIENIEAVFNYDIPQDDEYYVHRIGRTARAGKKGQAFTFVVGREIYKLRGIETYASTKIFRRPIPTLDDVEEVKTMAFLDKVKDILDKGDLERYEHLIEPLLKEDYTSLDIATALLKMIMDEEGKEYKEHKDYPQATEGKFKKERTSFSRKKPNGRNRGRRY
jgi:ATP-dependent RNA helicase DeaD